MLNMIVKPETHAAFQNFSEDGKQRDRSIVAGSLQILYDLSCRQTQHWQISILIRSDRYAAND